MATSLKNGDWTKLRQIIQRIKSSLSFFQPRRISQATQPTNFKSGEIAIWHDTVNSKVYWIYNDPDEGIKKIELL